jgi:PTH1 family peptidyl-tRNA hydrolase
VPAEATLRLVVGLGNPGREHVATRHNAGFWFADALAARLSGRFAHESRFFGEVARAGDVRLVKPMTYMNLSGRSVAALSRFYGYLPQDILVVHDELDLKPGDVRLKQGGGVAGHNGLRDIQGHLGSANFWRLRLGIGHPRDSDTPQQQVVDYVLRPPRAEERGALEAAIERGLRAWDDMARGDMERAMQDLHTKPAEAREEKS